MTKKQIEELQTIFSNKNVLTEVEDMLAYSYDASHVEIQPEAVVFATTSEQISQLMKFAYREKIPVTPRGQGSGLSGGSVPFKKGIVRCDVVPGSCGVWPAAARSPIRRSGIPRLSARGVEVRSRGAKTPEHQHRESPREARPTAHTARSP
jgi:hypothetical protein